MSATIGVAQPSSVDAAAFGSQIDLLGPTGSEWFGREVVVLTNGNYVVTDPAKIATIVNEAGCCYLLVDPDDMSNRAPNVQRSGLRTRSVVTRALESAGTSIQVGATPCRIGGDQKPATR